MHSTAMLSLGAIALMLSAVHAVKHTPITLVNQTAGVRENNSAFNPNTFRDGGTSTFVNGFHLQVFSDSVTCKTPDFNAGCSYGNGNFTSGVHNSIGYFGYPNTSDYTDVYTIAASTAPAGHQVFRDYDYALGYFPLGPEDDAYTTIWPNYVVTLPDNKTALVSAFVNETDGKNYYTLFTIDVVAPSEIPVGKSLNITRVPGVENGLSFPGAPQYCGQMLVNNAQSELFCFAIHGGVINMARVPIAEYGNLSAYHFYNASSGTYSQDAPPSADHSVAIISSPSGLGWASFYYSEYHETYVALIQQSYGGIAVTWSTSGEPAGPWTTPSHLLDLGGDPACAQYKYPDTLPYYVNAHPAWYGTDGNKLLIGWASCTAYVDMKTIEFA